MSDKPSVVPRDRKVQIEAILRACLRRRQAGEALTDEQVMADHPALMPELEKGLKKLRLVAAAREHAESPAAQVSAQQPPRTTAAPDPVEEWSTIPKTLLIPGYTLIRKISQGGQAFVYQATQDSTGRKVAVKVMREGPMASPRERARFEREVQILATINHPGIVEVLDRGVADDGSYFLVMDYIRGHSLDAYLEDFRQKHGGDADPGELLRLFLKICDAVNAAHLRGVVHRDLKPSNIRIDSDGEPHVLDFGLARTAVTAMTDETNPQPVTITGQFIGSLPWASPEQADGIASRIDMRSDVYSLGVVLYQMLTGQFPYEVVGTMRDVLNNILHAEPTPPTKVLAARQAKELEAGKRRRKRHRVEINAEIEAIVLKALCKMREGRYQTAGDLARDLTNYLSGRPTEAGGMEAHRRRAMTTKQIWTSIAAAAAMVVVATLIGGLLLHWQGRASRSLAFRDAMSEATARVNSRARSNANTAPGAISSPAPVPVTEAPKANAAPAPTATAPVVIAVSNKIPTLTPTAPAPRKEPILLDLGKGVKMEFEYIPAGTFVMGSPHNIGREIPRHTVTLSKPFYLGKTEVTLAQWNAVMGDDRRHEPPDHPVAGTWFDAQAFARKLSTKHPPQHARLPTEAEWEYACRAGTTGEYPGGDDKWSLEEYVSPFENGKSKPVGQKKANPWGLYDMHGNILEWCADWFGPYSAEPVIDPVGPSSGQWKVVRGTGAKGEPTAAARIEYEPGFGSSVLGFRVALDMPGTSTTVPSGEAATQPLVTREKPIVLDLGDGMKMEFEHIPPGSFMMGSNSRGDEVPIRKVDISKPFYIGKFEVTQAQWLAVMGKPSPVGWPEIKHGGADKPVHMASWNDCQAFMKKLAANFPGQTFRLPTEAEWEYACRAGSTGHFCFGDDAAQLGEYAWFDKNATGGLHPVGQKKSNAWGLHDMHGNQMEFCSDFFGDYAISGLTPPLYEITDPTGPSSGKGHVQRGGFWNTAEDGCRSAARAGSGPPDERGSGLRVVLIPAAPNPPASVKPKERVVNLGKGVKMEFVLIPAGSFTMGYKSQHEANPQHQVNITRDFWIGRHEVTQAQWLALMDGDRSELKGPQNPVTNVVLFDVQEFIRRLTARDPSLKPRLPTEAEWEYACRAGSRGVYFWGDDPWLADDFAWFNRNSENRLDHSVGQKNPNVWGLYDMLGNAAELCADWGRTYGQDSIDDPIGKTDGEMISMRGGNGSADVSTLAAGYRGSIARDNRSPGCGFRLVLEEPEKRAPAVRRK